MNFPRLLRGPLQSWTAAIPWVAPPLSCDPVDRPDPIECPDPVECPGPMHCQERPQRLRGSPDPDGCADTSRRDPVDRPDRVDCPVPWAFPGPGHAAIPWNARGLPPCRGLAILGSSPNPHGAAIPCIAPIARIAPVGCGGPVGCRDSAIRPTLPIP